MLSTVLGTAKKDKLQIWEQKNLPHTCHLETVQGFRSNEGKFYITSTVSKS